MNVAELIDLLSEMNPEAEVRLATQPSWPLQSSVAGVVDAAEIALDTECDEHGDYNCDECAEDDPRVVYIAEGSQISSDPYAPRAVWDNINR